MPKKSFKEFAKELQEIVFEPLPPNVMGSDDYEESLRESLNREVSDKSTNK